MASTASMVLTALVGCAGCGSAGELSTPTHGGDAASLGAVSQSKVEPAPSLFSELGAPAASASDPLFVVAPAAVTPPVRVSRCNEQPPQASLIRESYSYAPALSREERADRKMRHRNAIEYRTREYGHVEGFGDPSWNRLEPKDYAKGAKFMGIGVKMNVRVVSALSCVEEDIQRECAATPYSPRMLDSFRTKNTFHDNEVSNHLYGIAIDIDPDKNSCCGCVTPGAHWSKCDVKGLTAYERTALPRCWIDAFERYGFYWLGHDVALEDTMHFEFLGDPERITKHEAASASR